VSGFEPTETLKEKKGEKTQNTSTRARIFSPALMWYELSETRDFLRSNSPAWISKAKGEAAMWTPPRVALTA